MDAKTNSKYKPTIEVIKKKLTDNADALKIDQKDSNGYFNSTKVAESEIIKIKEMVEKIEAGLKK